MLLTSRIGTLITILLLFVTFTDTVARRHGSRGRGRINVKNNFTHGGIINNWVLMMPVRESQPDSGIESSADSSSKIYRDKLLESELFDSTGRLINRNANVWSKTRSHTVAADSNGWVTPNEDPYQFYYAYSTIEAHVSEAVRLFLLGRGVFRIWLNGKELTQGIGAVTGDEPIYFDAAVKQGDNSLLILFLPDGKNSFLLEMYPRKKELTPFKKRLETIEINVEPYTTGSMVLKGSYKFNIPVPKNSFYTDLTLSTDSDSVGSTMRVLDSFPPDSNFTFDIPPKYNGVVKLKASTTFPSGKKIVCERFLWIGNLKNDYNFLKSLSDSLSEEITKVNYLKLPMEDFLLKGSARWIKNWFNKNQKCENDRSIRELGYVRIGCDIMSMVISRGRFPRGGDFPILTSGEKDTSIEEGHYDHVNWLNYKYPKLYKAPSSKKVSGYEMWVSIPPSAYRKNRKIDMILYLHDLKSCNRLGISCLRFEGPNIIEKRRAIILSPFSNDGLLWDQREISSIIQKSSSSQRIKRCFITGEGMGGFEAYNQMILNNNIISAGIVLNAFTADDNICILKQKPIWIFHGNNSTIVPVENSLNTVNDLKECGNRRIIYSVFSEDGDKIGPVVYSDPVTYKWLFKQ